MATKTPKTAARAKAKAAGKAIEAQSTEMAYKIWLAGVGAYGKAYDSALAGATVVNKQSAEVFEDLVKRGAEIEQDVRARLAGNEGFTKASGRMSKAVETARDFQSKAQGQFESRMDRMRDLLGVKGMGTAREAFARRVEKLEDEVATVSAKARTKANDLHLKERIARLTAEIESVATETGADVAKTAKRVATRASKAVKAAMEPIEAEVADDLSQINGVGPAMVKKLHAAGITRFAQIAAMKKAELEALDAEIGARGRVLRDEWAKQAKKLAS
ncbi:putative NADH dehydrogenase I chain E [Hyphomonas hirschiana VP5]|uniref:Putative NADH dehydrogenase I chain E n=1 Tax=Hyphomonas hirschiana VP5 TaxID=1280951 RepID=A0A059F7A3_9PROT|nr:MULTISPECIES: phasin family protein [Hyphomonas]KCZ84006.1 putative NADH dehydrogenase I chain E [Hyphomonas hirschiana VP5]